jgi:cytoskeletal protein CcmA (bactofilin family)
VASGELVGLGSGSSATAGWGEQSNDRMALFKKDGARTPSEPTGKPGGFDKPRPAEATPVHEGTSMAASSVSRTPEGGQETAYLGEGTRLSGKISFEGPARIAGHVEGEVVASGMLQITESALVNAQISGETIVLRGKVTGDITASKKLEIRAPGKLFGNVTTPSLVIEEGVVFEGHCSMGASETRSERKVTLLAKEERPAESAPPPARAQADIK